MSSRDEYMPGPAAATTEVRKEGEKWTLVLVRELRHPPAKVWKALTDPASLREWAPFDADRSLGAVGLVKLTTVGTPTPLVSETRVTRAEQPGLLEYRWGEHDIRWQLEPQGGGTCLTLWHAIDRAFVSMGAAGWHICLDVLERLLGEDPIGRIVAGEAMKFGWPRLERRVCEAIRYRASQLAAQGPAVLSTRVAHTTTNLRVNLAHAEAVAVRRLSSALALVLE